MVRIKDIVGNVVERLTVYTTRLSIHVLNAEEHHYVLILE
jgi:hypothetical protein